MMKVRSVRQLNSSSVRSNGGFSLLELIISIAILAIIIGPLMSAFVVSSNSVTKSKRLADQNAAAQNVYEKIKARSGDYFFKWIRGDDKKNKKAGTVTDSFAEYEDLLDYFGANNTNIVSKADILSNSWASGTESNKKDNHGDIVYLSLPDIYENGSIKYSAAVTMQAGLGKDTTDASKSGDLGSLVDGSVLAKMNETKFTKPMTIDNIFVQPTDAASDPDSIVLSRFDPDNDVMVSQKRNIYIHFTKTNEKDADGKGTGRVTVRPIVLYCYDITYDQGAKAVAAGKPGAEKHRVHLYAVPSYDSGTDSISAATFKEIDGSSVTVDEKADVAFLLDNSFADITYEKTMSDGKLKQYPVNFYLCFQPYYDSKSNPRDSIVIDNTEGINGDVYLVKQNGDDTRAYSGVVRLIENHPDNKTKFNLSVHTNMGLMTDMETPITSGKIDFRKFYNVDKSKLKDFYRTRAASEPDIWYVNGSKDVSFNNLINQNAEEHIYSVTIRIYDSLQLSGSSYQWKNGYYMSSGKVIEPRYTLTGIKRG